MSPIAGADIESVIITVTYNCESFIDDFLQSVAMELSHPSTAHLIIVDNLSADQTVPRVERFIQDNALSEKITLLPQERNLGFGAGCNVGVAAAHCFNPKYYWFLNPDTKIFSQTLPQLTHFLDTNADAGFVCSQLVNEGGEARASGFRFPTMTTEFLRSLRVGVVDRLFGRNTIDIPVSTEAHKADWLTGASFMVRAEAFAALGGFDEAFFLYFEEVDLCFRANQRNLERWVNPASQVYHMAGASTGIVMNRKALKRRPGYWFDSRRHYFCKNHGVLYFALVDVVVIVGLSLFKLRGLIQRKESNDPPQLLRDHARNSVFLSPRKRR